MIHKLASRIATLPQRSVGELWERGAQAIAAQLERMGLRDARELSADETMGYLASAARAKCSTPDEWWWRRLARVGGGEGFFASFHNRGQTLAAIRMLEPAHEHDIRERADRTLRGRFDLLGYRDLSFGDPVDWHLDPLSGVRAPRRHWSRIGYLDARVVGDHKVVWELNRHQWLVTLGQAWWFTGDARYAEGALRAIESWMDANPPNRGVNWASSLEVAYRSIAWLWTLRLLTDAPCLTSGRALRIVGHLVLAGRHVERFLSTYFSPNTHLTGEALALFYLGQELAEFAPASRWKATGHAILLRQLPVHVRRDGTYFEQSTWYHRYSMDIYLHFLLLSESAGEPLPATVRDAISRMGTYLAAITRPDGTMPLLGDDDGGRLLFLDGRTAHDTRPALANVAVVTGRGDLACIAAAPSVELVWLMGPGGVEAFKRLEQRSPSFTSRAFPDGGVYVMRNSWRADADLMVIDAGLHGSQSCGHAHADALAFDLAVHGKSVFVDPGTFAYAHDAPARDAFRSSLRHNVVAVGGASSSEMGGPFSWKHIASCTVRRWAASPVADYLHGSHDGYRRLDTPAHYERRVLHVKSGYWVILDQVTGGMGQIVEARFQCAPGRTATVSGAGEVLVLDQGETLVRLVIPSGTGTLTVAEGEVSSTYGAREPASLITYSQESRGHVTIVTVCVPTDDPVTRVTCLDSGRSSVLYVARNGDQDVVVLGHGDGVSVGDVETDAEALWVRRDTITGRARSWFISGGSRLSVAGESLLAQASLGDAWSEALASSSERGT